MRRGKDDRGGNWSLVKVKKDKDCCISNEDIRILKWNSKLTLCKCQIKSTAAYM